MQSVKLSDNPKTLVKQPKVPEAPSVPSVPRGPRYRYFSNPPKTIDLRLGDLNDIPSTAFTPFYDADRRIAVPAEDILGGPVPKISFARLAELVPDAFQVGIHSGVHLRVPASRLALSYQLVESRELIEEPVEDLPLPPPVEETFALLDTLPPPTGEKFAPVVDDLPPPPTAKDLPKEPGAEESSFKPKLPPIAPPTAVPVAKVEPVEPPAPKPPLPQIAPPTAAVPTPEPPKPVPIEAVAPVASAVAPAPQEPLPTVPTPAAITPAPEVPKPEPPPVATKVEPPAAPVVESLKPLPKPVPIITPPAPVQETTPPPAPPAPVAATPEPVVPPPASPSPEQVAPPAPIARRPFSLLPIFRRKVVEPAKPIVAPEPRARVEIPKPKKPLAPLTSMNVPPVEPPVAPPPPKPAKPEIPALAILKEEPAEPKAAAPEPKIVPKPPSAPEVEAIPEAKLTPEPKAPAPIPIPPPVVLKEEIPPPVSAPAPIVQAIAPEKSEAVFVETEHFPQGGKDIPTEIPEQDSLQALFLTEDVLSVERVIELCNGLPGIKSCILTRSGSVVNARNVPDSIDLISLSANALEMFRALRGSCAKMGIGAVPAVTMHSQKGPITFFHEQDICLLVLHKDRGFVPGVREKLQMVVEELSKANLLLPVSERGTKELK